MSNKSYIYQTFIFLFDNCSCFIIITIGYLLNEKNMDNNLFWKEFESVEVTHSSVHYLFAIDKLLWQNGYARAVDISKELNITAWSCSIWLKNLLKKWFIIEDDNKFVRLSKKWEKIKVIVNNNREIWIDFFINNLWLSKDEAAKNACKLEHLIDPEVSIKLKDKFLW